MFYIHQYACISAQETFGIVDLGKLHAPVDKQLKAIEPAYDAIPPGILRRMGKSVRMGVGAALPTLKASGAVDGIIIGTANGGKEDCVKFLNQIIDYDEGMLTPVNFVQSTPNAVAAQIGLLTKNHGYNITHLHHGLAFEYAAIDADMMLEENQNNIYLLGAVDDISSSNYIFDDKSGWHKTKDISNTELYSDNSTGSIAGEGSAMFIVNMNPANAVAKLAAIDTLHNADVSSVKEKLQYFLQEHLAPGEKIDLFLSGENGDNRLMKFYAACESVLADDTPIARFKHFSGEYPTASAMGLWLGCYILNRQSIPESCIKRKGTGSEIKNILLYNNYRMNQHSFMLVSLP